MDQWCVCIYPQSPLLCRQICFGVLLEDSCYLCILWHPISMVNIRLVFRNFISDLWYFFLRTSSLAPTLKTLIRDAWGSPSPYGGTLFGGRYIFIMFSFLTPLCGSILGSAGFTFSVFDPLNIEVVIVDMIFARRLEAFCEEGTHKVQTCRIRQ